LIDGNMINVFGSGVCPGVRGFAEIVGGPTGAVRKCPLLRLLSGVRLTAYRTVCTFWSVITIFPPTL